VAGRTGSSEGGAEPFESAERAELTNEVERLRKRARQQEEALARLVEALSAMRRGGRALRAENRELRLALQEASRSERPTEAHGERFL
jgi:hypothetical protein